MGQSSTIPLRVLNCSNFTFQIKFGNKIQDFPPKHGMQTLNCATSFDIIIENTLYKTVQSTAELFIYADGDPSEPIKILNYPLRFSGTNSAQRPFWLIAHEVNNPADIPRVLQSGANACEIDVLFSPETKTWHVQHDALRPLGVSVTDWCKAAKAYQRDLMMIMIDVKSKCSALVLELLLTQVRTSKFPGAIVFCVPSDISCLLTLEKKLHANEGLATDFLSINTDMVGKLPENSNIWYGNGLASFLPKPNLYSNITNAVFLRDEGQKIKKVFVWTIASTYAMQVYLETNLDAIMVEQDFIQTARRIVDSYVFVRMATKADHPFEKSEPTCDVIAKLI